MVLNINKNSSVLDLLDELFKNNCQNKDHILLANKILLTLLSEKNIKIYMIMAAKSCLPVYALYFPNDKRPEEILNDVIKNIDNPKIVDEILKANDNPGYNAHYNNEDENDGVDAFDSIYRVCAYIAKYNNWTTEFAMNNIFYSDKINPLPILEFGKELFIEQNNHEMTAEK